MKLNMRYPEDPSIKWSIFIKEYESLGHATLRSVRSIHVPLVFLFSRHNYINQHVGYIGYVMNPRLDNLSTFSSMVALFSLTTFCFLCATRLANGLIERWWQTTQVSIAGMLDEVQANKSMFLMSWSTSLRSYSLVSEVLKFVTWWDDEPVFTSFKSFVGVIISLTIPILGSQQSIFVYGSPSALMMGWPNMILMGDMASTMR